MPLQHNIRISVLRLFNKFQGFATSSVDFTLASLVLKQLTKAYSISSGTWLRQCIVEYQYLVKPFLTIRNRGSKGRYATSYDTKSWEVRREATRFFYYFDANKVSRVSLGEIHMNATVKLEQWHAYNPQSTLTRAASEDIHRMTCPEAIKALLSFDPLCKQPTLHWSKYPALLRFCHPLTANLFFCIKSEQRKHHNSEAPQLFPLVLNFSGTIHTYFDDSSEPYIPIYTNSYTSSFSLRSPFDSRCSSGDQHIAFVLFFALLSDHTIPTCPKQ